MFLVLIPYKNGPDDTTTGVSRYARQLYHLGQHLFTDVTARLHYNIREVKVTLLVYWDDKRKVIKSNIKILHTSINAFVLSFI